MISTKNVQDFMTASGQATPDSPVKETDLSRLYQMLITEEYNEFLEAVDVNDDAKKLDACFDLIWVIIGYCKARGWNIDYAWIEGAMSNLAKIDPETGSCLRREDGKILKPAGWMPPVFSKFVTIRGE